MKTLQKKLSTFYYTVFVSAALFAVLIGYFFKANNLVITNNIIIDVLKSVIIVYMLIIIPFSLKVFSVKTKKIAQIENETEKFAKYSFLVKTRIMLISDIIFIGILAFFILQKTDIQTLQYDFLYVAGIGAVALIFCHPTINKIENDLFNEQLTIDN